VVGETHREVWARLQPHGTLLRTAFRQTNVTSQHKPWFVGKKWRMSSGSVETLPEGKYSQTNLRCFGFRPFVADFSNPGRAALPPLRTGYRKVGAPSGTPKTLANFSRRRKFYYSLRRSPRTIGRVILALSTLQYHGRNPAHHSPNLTCCRQGLPKSFLAKFIGVNYLRKIRGVARSSKMRYSNPTSGGAAR